jgi:glucosamine-6-phosphate deaminase
MRVIITKDYEEMSDRAAEIMLAAIEANPKIVLGLATGSTPVGLYRRMADAHAGKSLDFSQVVTFNLDEYVGLAPDHDQSYRYFMNTELFNHVNIKPENTHVPDGLSESLLASCADYEKMIAEAGGIDLQVLGIGRDGHLAFNEPGTSLGSRTHVTSLTEETISDNSRFFDNPEDVPRFAVTMGIASILEARQLLFMANGENKADVVAAALEGPISVSVTASAMQLHPDVVAIVDEPAAGRLRRRDFYLWQEQNRGLIADRL